MYLLDQMLDNIMFNWHFQFHMLHFSTGVSFVLICGTNPLLLCIVMLDKHNSVFTSPYPTVNITTT